MTDAVAARRLWANLSLLDRQLVDRDGALCGNVDDVELASTAEGALMVVGLRSGSGALVRRLGARRFGDWLERAHKGVDDDSRDHTVIPLARVADIGNHVTISMQRDELASEHTERWVRDHIIQHIPGAEHAAE
jgi:hypothetical protein